jgi:probable rRNA maturation factor
MADGDHTGPRILIDDRQAEARLDEEGLVTLARTTLVGEDAADTELSVSFVTEEEMSHLHARFMGEEGPTDVLSFPLGEEDRDEDGLRMLGDVVIAPTVAHRQNPTDPSAEVRLLLVHGILHLLGHDHDRDDDRAAMWAIQERYTGTPVP